MANRNLGSETGTPRSSPAFATERVLSTFPSIDTAADHIKISQGLERVARVMDRGAIIKSFQDRISDTSCTRAISITGTPDTSRQSLAMPHIGSVVSRTLGRRIRRCAFIAIGQNMEMG